MNMKNSMMSKYEPIVIHYKHNLKLVCGRFGPHTAKFICTDCNNKFVKWASKDEVNAYKHLKIGTHKYLHAL